MANKKAEEPEQISSSSSDSGSEDEQKAEGAQQEPKEGEGSPSRSRQSRNERKARKAILRLGMKPMPDIVKVVIRKAKQSWFVIAEPDVYKSTSTDAYVVFGHAEGVATQAHSEAAQRFTQGAVGFGGGEGAAAAAAAAAKEEGALGSPAENFEGVNKRDLDLIVSQLGCSRERAIDALKKHNNDLVEAILDITA
ncbi:nascent polypeptide-associated complex alpha chain, putative [Eimeria necatrix]|uniref:Nascent polypeptide-associated complex alpha chain, putative n=1 Tax=Eimeria necatrix TaxID=51315 RepID=U6N051_9EIME|nr:nascent polypeptide-associated complex alpha chain, putative [Eimeria necatrix]CDJ69572.1 nascent polypeptide-associated complex alpha chain, putative [Eimeria necatrix]